MFASAIERLYDRLLRIETASGLDAALVEVLRSLADVTRCDLVYLELRHCDDYWLAHATYSLPPGALRARVCRELVQRALRQRVTVTEILPAALQRWRSASNALCTPIGAALPLGVLYAECVDTFGEIERARFERVAGHLARVIPTAFLGPRPALADEVRVLKDRRIREAMHRHDGNIAEVARVLGVSRTLIYRALHGDVALRDTEAGRVSSDATDPSDMERDETEIAADLRLEGVKRIANNNRT